MSNITSCEHTEEITCPYCGHVYSDSDSFLEDSDKYVCHQCQQEFLYVRYIDVTYFSYPIDKE